MKDFISTLIKTLAYVTIAYVLSVLTKTLIDRWIALFALVGVVQLETEN